MIYINHYQNLYPQLYPQIQGDWQTRYSQLQQLNPQYFQYSQINSNYQSEFQKCCCDTRISNNYEIQRVLNNIEIQRLRNEIEIRQTERNIINALRPYPVPSYPSAYFNFPDFESIKQEFANVEDSIDKAFVEIKNGNGERKEKIIETEILEEEFSKYEFNENGYAIIEEQKPYDYENFSWIEKAFYKIYKHINKNRKND